MWSLHGSAYDTGSEDVFIALMLNGIRVHEHRKVNVIKDIFLHLLFLPLSQVTVSISIPIPISIPTSALLRLSRLSLVFPRLTSARLAPFRSETHELFDRFNQWATESRIFSFYLKYPRKLSMKLRLPLVNWNPFGVRLQNQCLKYYGNHAKGFYLTLEVLDTLTSFSFNLFLAPFTPFM